MVLDGMRRLIFSEAYLYSLFSDRFESAEGALEKMSTDNKLPNYKWLKDRIGEAKERVILINGSAIHKNTLRFTRKSYKFIMRYYIKSLTKDNTLCVVNPGLLSNCVAELELNIL